MRGNRPGSGVGGVDLRARPHCCLSAGRGNVFDIRWTRTQKYAGVRLAEEQQFSSYSFDYADPAITRQLFELHEREARQLLQAYADATEEAKKRFPVLAAYDQCLKCSHLYVLDSRGVISVTERAALIGRVRQLACRTAAAYLAQRALNAPPDPFLWTRWRGRSNEEILR